MIGRLSLAGRFWLSYACVLLALLVWAGGASAAINDAGWTDCAGMTDYCSVSGAWVRRGQGSDFVTRWAPTGSGVFCQAYYSNEYGEKGFGSRADVTGDRCYYKAAEGTVYPADAGLGFVAGTSYPGGYVTGVVTPLCLGGVACTGPDGEPDPDPPGDPASGATAGALAVDQSLTLLLAAVILFFVFHGYSVGSRR